jgi:hypothetical protein
MNQDYIMQRYKRIYNTIGYYLQAIIKNEVKRYVLHNN